MGMYTGLKGKVILKEKYKSLAERYEFEWNMWLSEAPELKEWDEYTRSSMIPYGALCYMPNEWDKEPVSYNNGEWFLCCSLKDYENTIHYFITKVLPIIADSWDLEELYEEDDNPTKHQHNVESKYE